MGPRIGEKRRVSRGMRGDLGGVSAPGPRAAVAPARIPAVRSPAAAVRGAAAHLRRGRQATMPPRTPA